MDKSESLVRCDESATERSGLVVCSIDGGVEIRHASESWHPEKCSTDLQFFFLDSRLRGNDGSGKAFGFCFCAIVNSQ